MKHINTLSVSSLFTFVSVLFIFFFLLLNHWKNSNWNMQNIMTVALYTHPLLKPIRKDFFFFIIFFKGQYTTEIGQTTDKKKKKKKSKPVWTEGNYWAESERERYYYYTICLSNIILHDRPSQTNCQKNEKTCWNLIGSLLLYHNFLFKFVFLCVFLGRINKPCILETFVFFIV